MKNLVHLTAINRDTPSFPFQYLYSKGFIKSPVLDYGSGREKDYKTMVEQGLDAQRYDTYYYPNRPQGLFKTILCTYVLNVLEPQFRIDVLRDIDQLLTPYGEAYISVTRFVHKPTWSVKHTFQDYVTLPLPIIYENSRLCIYLYRREFLSDIIGENNFIGGLATADKSRVRTKEYKSIRLMQSVAERYHPWFLAYSGGKDSEVLLHLAEKAGIEYTPYYNSTTIDIPNTLSWVQKHEQVMINRPAKTFFEIIAQRGFPNHRRRFCCEMLKEKRMASHIFTGVRKAESNRRKELYKEPEMCFVYKHGQTSTNVMPLLEWTDKDIEQYIALENIKCHPHYYNQKGQFDVKRRIGCLACPLREDRGREQFLQYPRLVKLWCRAMAIYRNTRKQLIKDVTKYADEYAAFYCHIHKITPEILKESNINPKTELEQEFNIELPEPQSDIKKIMGKLDNTQSL